MTLSSFIVAKSIVMQGMEDLADALCRQLAISSLPEPTGPEITVCVFIGEKFLQVSSSFSWPMSAL